MSTNDRQVESGTPGASIEKLRRALAQRAWEKGTSLELIRSDFESAVASMKTAPGVCWESGDLGGVGGEWCRPESLRHHGAVLHLHGGGYTTGSSRTVRPMVSQLAVATGSVIFSPDYRLAPEAPFPAAVEDAMAAYSGLVDHYDPGQVAITGDSAGGGLAVACVVGLRSADRALPAAVAVMSPWTDLTLSSESLDRNEPLDPQVSRWRLAEFAEMYLAGADPKDPLASPVYADLRELPPMLVQVGGDEGLLDDGVRLVEAAKVAGGDAVLDTWEGMIHVWQAFAPVLPEAVAALDAMAAWLDRQWSSG